MPKYDVIVPAGGYLKTHMADVVGTKAKPLIRFEGQTILYRVLTALRASECVGRIAVVGSKEVVAHEDAKLADFVLLERETGPQNIIAGLDALSDAGTTERVMICTSDLCFITPESICEFADKFGDRDFYAPLIEEDAWEEAFPTCAATFVKLLDGKFTLGCLYGIRTEALKRALAHIEKVFSRRKSKLGMARLLGFQFVYAYLVKKLTVKDVVNKVGEVLGSTIEPIWQSPPELAFDIDALEDYHYALQNYRNCTQGKWTPPRAE